ncbi:MAG: hypothetical protein JNM17_12690 [Archangium sp.]|nr:hypothetical protein [Archangium sp.]
MRVLIVFFVTSVLLLVACGRPCATAKCPDQCLDEAGRSNGTNGFADRAPAQQGSCGSSVACSQGCTCNGTGDGGTPSCLCTGAIPANPGFLCVSAPSCGFVSCGAHCSCADAGAGLCACN